MSATNGLGHYDNEKRAKQLIRFDGMVFDRNKSFTDTDAIMDYRGIAWLMFEVKTGDAKLTTGQRILAEHFVEMARDAGRYAVVAVVEHHVDDCSQPVYLADCDVRELYDSRGMEWRRPKEPMKAKLFASRFVWYVRRMRRNENPA